MACGTGQSTFPFVDRFSHCTGVDISEAQIKEAQRIASSLERSNVTFKVGKAEDLPVQTNTMDLVTIATAWHWLESPELFYSECKRVLKPKGCIAVYSYGFFWLAHDEANVPFTKFLSETLGDYWAENIHHVRNNLAEVVLPFANVERYDFEMVQQFSLVKLMGFIASLSPYQKYCDVHPGNKILEELEATLAAIFTANTNTTVDSLSIDVHFPVIVILGQNISY